MSNDLLQISSFDQADSRQRFENPGSVTERAVVLEQPNSGLMGSAC
jgi:hypothetical protein